MINISIIGLGFVGSAMLNSFNNKITEYNYKNKYKIYGYDKYKNNSTCLLKDCLQSQIIFLALPTIYSEFLKEYDKFPLYEICLYLQKNNYSGVIVVKSTIEPETILQLENSYNLNIIHNPEFLSAKTAYIDFHNQTHIVLGITKQYKNIDLLYNYYTDLYPNATISICNSSESECMKLFCNSFYAIKIQFFNELYQVCSKTPNVNFNIVRNLMLKNNWIHPQHTNVPGPDNKLSYGGMCFPKDTNALLQYMKTQNTPSAVLEATIIERNIMRN
jgi:nucleotide sugar dehydrogenase